MTEVFFSGTVGLIEGRHYSLETAGNVALVFPPDPRFGATLNNKTTSAITRAMRASGFSTLNINYRGVGRSAGTVPSDTKELQDAALQDATSAMDWMQLRHKGFTSFWVVGFSFGSWVAMQAAMRRPEVCGAIFVCPPIETHDLSFLMPCPVPCAIVHAADDSTVSDTEMNQFVAGLNKNRGEIPIAEYFVVHGADHFFSNALPELAQTIYNYSSSKLRSGPGKRTIPGFKERKRRKTPAIREVVA